jgi:hypothetical protein
MSIIDDIANAIETYPADEVEIAITDVALQTGTTGSVNVNEVWKFKVNVTNNGHMNMNAVSLHVTGQNGALIGTAAAGPFSGSTQTIGSLSVPGGGSSAKTAYIYFKAPPSTKPAGTDLVAAHVADFSADFNHFFTNHTLHAPTPEAVYEAQVFP